MSLLEGSYMRPCMRIYLPFQDLDAFLDGDTDAQALVGILGRQAVKTLIPAVVSGIYILPSLLLTVLVKIGTSALEKGYGDPCTCECNVPYTPVAGGCACMSPYSMCHGVCGLFPTVRLVSFPSRIVSFPTGLPISDAPIHTASVASQPVRSTD